MPNGDPDWVVNELPKLEEFFHKISHVLEDFAKVHNLLIDKYYHQGSDWTFRFKHSRGGTGLIEVKKFDDEHVLVGACWQLCDYDTCTLFSMRSDQKKLPLDCEALKRFLYDTLAKVLAWKRSELVPGKKGEYHWWKDVSKEEFERENEKYPLPKLD